MTKEKNEMIETKQRIILSSSEDNKTDQELIDNFLSHSDEEYSQMGEEIEEAERKREEEEKKKEEPLQGLKDFRELWKQRIERISEESKKKIIETADKIPVEIEMDSDGSRLIEFKLYNRTYKILDPNLKNHTDEKYGHHDDYYYSITKMDRDFVKLGGMRGENLNLWKNQKLRDYVKKKREDGLFIPGFEEIETLLEALGNMAGLRKEEDQIAMLMYLTGLNGCYWLSMDAGIQRSRILFAFKAHYRLSGVDEHEHNNLLMMHCE